MHAANTRTPPTLNVHLRVDLDAASPPQPTTRYREQVHRVIQGFAIVGLVMWLRRWHTAWGATKAERDETLPGDEIPVSRFGMRATRAITIAAAPADVWPWITQIGTGKAGWYSYDLLDNLARPSATVILPQWQHPQPGDPAAPMNPFAPVDQSPWIVERATPGQVLLWSNHLAGTWAWILRPTPAGGTRLVTRIRISYNTPSGLAFAPILELADFPMYRRMLLGIKQRSETLTQEQDQQSFAFRQPL